MRLDIYASSEGASAQPAQAPGAAAPQVSVESDRRRAELQEREVELDRTEATLVARTRRLDEREGTLRSREAELERSVSSVAQRMRALDEREGTLAEREAEVAQAHDAGVAMADVERWRRRLAAEGESLTERTLELQRFEQQAEERERLLAEREARVGVELDLREDELEDREKAVADQEERLVRKERELTMYVGQLQGRLTVAQ